MILPMRFIVIKVLEASHLLCTEEERDETISVIDSIDLLSVQELFDIVFHNRHLSHSGILRPSSRSIDA